MYSADSQSAGPPRDAAPDLRVRHDEQAADDVAWAVGRAVAVDAVRRLGGTDLRLGTPAEECTRRDTCTALPSTSRYAQDQRS